MKPNWKEAELKTIFIPFYNILKVHYEDPH